MKHDAPHLPHPRAARAVACTTTRAVARTTTLAGVLWLAGCGGWTDASIGGTLSGLGDGLTVVLQNNGADNLRLTENGSFAFATGVASGETYSVTVLTQPVGQACNVSSGTGAVDSKGSDVTDIEVTCTANSSVGGTLTGMLAGRSITLANAGQLLAVAQNGSFAFPGVLAAGSRYEVTITTQPAGQTCRVVNGSGTVVANVMATVAVTCS